MNNIIRLCCAKIFIVLALFGLCDGKELIQFPVEEAILLDMQISTQSGSICAGHPFSMHSTQYVKGMLSLTEEWRSSFPVHLHFCLDDVQWKAEHGENSASNSFAKPGQSIEFNELKAFKAKSVPFSLTRNPPFLTFSEDFLRRFGDLEIFKNNLFPSLIGEDLFTLFAIASRPLPLGEGFEIHFEKDEKRPFRTSKTFVVKEISPDQITVEVNTQTERQRVALSSLDQAVIFSQSKALWTIKRANGLLFRVQERGTLTQALRIGDIEMTQQHTFERTISTSPMQQTIES